MNKKVTLETLAASINNLATREEIKTDIENLAIVVAAGFDEVKNDISAVKYDLSAMKNDLSELQTDVSNISLRLDYLAPKFEVHDLEKRVTKLEIHTGIRSKK